MRTDLSTASDSTHSACPGPALAVFIGASDVMTEGRGPGGAVHRESPGGLAQRKSHK